MSIATARMFIALMKALAIAFISQLVAMSIKAYPLAFNAEALRSKASMGFMAGVGRVLWLVYWGQFTMPAAAFALLRFLLALYSE